MPSSSGLFDRLIGDDFSIISKWGIKDYHSSIGQRQQLRLSKLCSGFFFYKLVLSMLHHVAHLSIDGVVDGKVGTKPVMSSTIVHDY